MLLTPASHAGEFGDFRYRNIISNVLMAEMGAKQSPRGANLPDVCFLAACRAAYRRLRRQSHGGIGLGSRHSPRRGAFASA
jgi:hypothetical protein